MKILKYIFYGLNLLCLIRITLSLIQFYNTNTDAFLGYLGSLILLITLFTTNVINKK